MKPAKKKPMFWKKGGKDEEKDGKKGKASKAKSKLFKKHGKGKDCEKD